MLWNEAKEQAKAEGCKFTVLKPKCQGIEPPVPRPKMRQAESEDGGDSKQDSDTDADSDSD